jgi:bifunctional non-homologous end joining protein LigD
MSSVSREEPDCSGRSDLVVDGIRIKNPDRVYFADRDDVLTKADLVEHYLAVRPWLERHIVGRPVMLLRCPEGTAGQCFHQRHPWPATPEAIGRVWIGGGNGAGESLVFDSYRSVVAAAGIGALELHIWASRADQPARPDRMVFDFDPGEHVSFSWVKEAAVELGEMLEEAGLVSFVMTTGGKGLHLVVPLTPDHEFAEVRDHARSWAHHLVLERPDRYIDHPSKAKRHGLIYIDVLRNGQGATAICPWSTRAHPNAPVATPIDWEELDQDFGPNDLTVRTVGARLASAPRDPWEGYFDVSQRITKAAWAAISALH